MVTKERAEKITNEKYHEIFKLVYSKDNISYHDAEEITQETFLLFYKKLNKLIDKDLTSWLKNVATKKCLEFYRKHNLIECLISLEEVITTREDILSTVDNYDFVSDSDIEKAMNIILKTLKKDEFAVYYKKFVENKKHKQIAEELGITVSNVGTIAFRTREKIEKLAAIAFSGPGQFIIRLFF